MLISCYSTSVVGVRLDNGVLEHVQIELVSENVDTLLDVEVDRDGLTERLSCVVSALKEAELGTCLICPLSS